MPWTTPRFTKNEVRDAGDILLTPPPLSDSALWDRETETAREKYSHAQDVINNWRSAHGYPLWVFQRTLRTKAALVDDHALVSQRLKRLQAIRLKLSLHRNMSLSQMQDIGGCRAVVHSVDAAYELASIYERNRSLRHTLRRKTDYISTPRASGYRGIHLIYKYQGRVAGPFDTLQIEMQIRTEVQHIWATAVETVGSFLSQALKSSLGQDVWLRFFALMGSATAKREQTSLVGGTPDNSHELISELRRTANDLQVESRLRAYGAALRTIGTDEGEARYYLLELDTSSQTVSIKSFKASETEKANTEYLQIEKSIAGQPDKEAVLVSVHSFSALRTAYPSFFMDTGRFLTLLSETLAA
jgi:ppGpp synthetase/RelA/SpoT-type nucleotidyltranferase